MFNLKKVIRFEVLKTIKKPSFWASILIIPLIWAAIFGLQKASIDHSKEDIKNKEKETFSFEVVDNSKILNQQIVEMAGGKFSPSKQDSIEKVKSGKIDAFYFVPENLENEKAEIYQKFESLTESSKYEIVFSSLMKASSTQSIDKNELIAANSNIKTSVKNFKNGKEYFPMREVIIPGMFAVAFYIIVGFLSGRMLTSVTEEKENRVSEIILANISAKMLIVGKILSFFILAFIQVLTLVSAVLITLSVFSEQANVSKLLDQIGGIAVNPQTIAVSVAIFISGLIMTISFIIAFGASMPTAQEAGSWLGTIIMLQMTPLFIVPMLMSKPNEVVQFLSFIPLTSPITLLIRNTLGTLELSEAIIGVGLLTIFSVITIKIAIRVFQFGTVSYGEKIKLKSVFSKK